MSRLRVEELLPEHLDQVAALAAGAHDRARRHESLLSAAYSDPATVLGLLGTTAEETGGYAAVRGDQVTAALVGGPGTPSGTSGRTGLRAAQVPVLGAVGDPDDLADVYSVAAREWVNQDALRHVVMVLAGDGATHDVLVSLGFGREQAYAVRELPQVDDASDGASTDDPVPDGRVTVRRATLDDLHLVVPISSIVTEHQQSSPTFSMASAAWFDDLPGAMAAELADDTAYLHVAADDDGTAVGIAASYDDPVTPIVPDLAVGLSIVGVDPAHRGRGIGLLLTKAALTDAQSRGRRAVHADWRTTNLLAARFWPRRGFRPVAYRMVRTIDLSPF